MATDTDNVDVTNNDEDIVGLEKKALESLDALTKKANDDQGNYDRDREAIDDSAKEKADDEKASKKWNDDTRSDNWIDNKKNISVTAYMQVQHLTPSVTKAIIGHNEYFQLPKRRLPELPLDAREEIQRIHGSQVYAVLDDYGNIPEYPEDAICIPVRTSNTPRYFENADIQENFTHDNVFRDNVALFEQLREAREANQKKMVL